MTATLRTVTATLLATCLAVASGCSRPGAAASVATGAQSTATGSLPSPRSHVTLAPLGELAIAVGGYGPLYVGTTARPLGSSWVFDPGTAPSIVEAFYATAPLGTARFDAVAVPVGEGGAIHGVLAVGGRTGDDTSGFTPTGAADLFIPLLVGTLVSSPVAPMPAPRADHAAAPLPDGKALVCGGIGAVGWTLSDCLVFDPGAAWTTAWTPVAPMAQPRRSFTLTLLQDGKVLAAGGVGDSGALAGTELYDPATDAWTAISGAQPARFAHRAFRLQDGRVVLVGGSTGASPATASALIYDPATQAMAEIAPLAAGRADCEGALLPDGRVLVAGGRGPAGEALASVEILDPGQLGWTSAAPMVEARDQFGLALLADGRVLVVGGANSGAPYLSSAELVVPDPSCLSTSACAGLACGTIPDGCGGTLTCGTCGAGEVCSAHACVAPTAAFDATYRAPRCAAAAPACDSGTLLVGRGPVGPEPHEPNTLTSLACPDGTGGRFHSDESLDRLRVASLDGAPLTAGRPAVVEATVWAYTGFSSDHLDLYLAPSAAAPAWTFLGTLTPTAAGAQTLSTTILLPAGETQVLRGAFRYQGSAAPCTTGTYDDRDDLVFTVVSPRDAAAPFAAIVSPAANAVVKGVVPVTVETADDVGVARIELWDVDGLPTGVPTLAWDAGGATTAVHTFLWDVTALSTSAHTLVARAVDAAGNVGTSAPVPVVVIPDPAPVATIALASHDPVRRVPACATRAAGCDTGTLVNGRGAAGPEANAPNTLGGSCADGTSGAYHSDESLDRLRVSTVSGSPLAPGQRVRVEATVFAWGTGAEDHLDVWYAADAAAPLWTLAGTVTAAAGGLQTLAVEYVLPAGSVQAVRGSFRYGGGSTTPCTPGAFDDHDDLVFVTR